MSAKTSTTTTAPAVTNRDSELAAELQRCTAVRPISSAADYVAICDLRKANRLLYDKACQTFDPLIKTAIQSVDQARKTKAEFTEPLDRALLLIDIEIDKYEQIDSQRQSLAEQKLADEMTTAAQTERAAEIKTLQKTGYIRAAKQLAEMPLEVVIPSVPSGVPKVAGFTKRPGWQAEVYNFLDLITAVASGKVQIEALKPNYTFLNSAARASQTLLNIPGVRAKAKTIRSQRRS